MIKIPDGITFTRPANTTAYAAEDVVSDGSVITFTFDDVGEWIVGATFMTSLATVTARHRLHLFRDVPTAIADNAPFTGPLFADRTKYVGAIDSNAFNAEGSGATAAYAANTDIRLPFDTSGDRALFGILETLDAYTPASAQQFFIQLAVYSDR